MGGMTVATKPTPKEGSSLYQQLPTYLVSKVSILFHIWPWLHVPDQPTDFPCPNQSK